MQRLVLLAPILVLLLLRGTGPNLIMAQDGGTIDIRELIRKAISAEGGRDRLVEMERTYFRVKVKTKAGEGHIETWAELPLREKTVARYEKDGRQIIRTRVTNEKEEWEKLNNEDAIPARTVDLNATRESQHCSRMLLLYPILEDKDVVLMQAGAQQNETQWCVKVKSAGFQNIDMYFDKSTARLLRYSYRSISPQTLGKQIDIYRSDFRDFGIYNIASKFTIKIDDKTLSTDEVVEFRTIKAFPTEFFSRP